MNLNSYLYIVIERFNGFETDASDNVHCHYYLSLEKAKKRFKECVDKLKSRDNSEEEEKENLYWCSFMDAEYEVEIFERKIE